ncbi:MAG: hypothetical protein DSM106950_30000 [Stigonema ocellatum SAG 48.90 = DSM 106950]|nr:hypothetical protein [Stigonema ocellatum SAG 48.90 = DSM 106950]
MRTSTYFRLFDSHPIENRYKQFRHCCINEYLCWCSTVGAGFPRLQLLSDNEPETAQAISNYGELTRIVAASSQQLESILETLHPGDAILVRTNPQRENLRGVFDSTLVFTIEEAKGLEFDTVFLGNF